MPSHLRKFALDYALNSWLDTECPLEAYYETVHLLLDRLERKHHSSTGETSATDPSAQDQILVNLVAQFLDAEGILEDYVLANPVADHNLNEEGAVVPVLEAAAILIVRRYRRAIDRGEWSPPSGPEEEQ